MAKTKSGVGGGSLSFKPKAKKRGKGRKKFGPKDQKPKPYRGQGR
jgi:hypothetical protein